MRIAFVIGEFPTLSETFILNQITGLLDLGHEVDILPILKPNESKMHPDVKKYDLLARTYYREMPARKLWRLMKAVGLLATRAPHAPATVLRSLNCFRYGKDALSLRIFYDLLPSLGRGAYDIIHCHFGPMGILGALLKALGVKGKLVVTFHAHDLTVTVARDGQGVYDGLFQAADLILPISDHWKSRLIELGCSPEKIVVHRMGVNTEQFRYRAACHLNAQAIKLLTVSRLVEKKGVEYGIRAVATVSSRRPEWLIQYDIVGEGPLKRRLEAIAEDLGITSVVRFLGPKTHETIRELMMQAHIFMLPSVTAANGDQEGIPVVLMEAMATGLPVLSSIHSGIPELVVDGESGFLVAERDVEALAERLEYLVDHSELWPKMGRAGRSVIEEYYDIRKLNHRLEALYQSLLTGSIRESRLAVN